MHPPGSAASVKLRGLAGSAEVNLYRTSREVLLGGTSGGREATLTSYRSERMRHAMELCRLYAPFNRPTVLVGPVGAGKTMLAEEVWRASGLEGSFVAVSSGELIETLFADTLFGHVQGAFTGATTPHQGAFAQAANGALLLDDLALMPMVVQAAILRVMESGAYRPLGATKDELTTCRLMFATTEEPRALVGEGRLLRDLESRLGEFVVRVPPLSTRRGEIVPMALSFACELLSEHELQGEVLLTDSVKGLLCTYNWPGNVRELRAVIERAVAHAGVHDGRVSVHPAHLPEHVRTFQPVVSGSKQPLTASLVESTLRMVGGNKSEAARRLGVHRNTIGKYVPPLADGALSG